MTEQTEIKCAEDDVMTRVVNDTATEEDFAELRWRTRECARYVFWWRIWAWLPVLLGRFVGAWLPELFGIYRGKEGDDGLPF